MSIADQIDTYLRSRLSLIRKGASIPLFGDREYSCQTDAGQQVDKNLEYTEHPDILPSVVYYTGPNTTMVDDTVELGMENHLQEVSVEGFIECDKAGTEADQLRLDIAAALRGDPWWNGLILELQDIKTDISIQNGEDVFAVVKFSANALYTCPFGSE